MLLALVAGVGQTMQAQTLTVLHTFAGPDGLFPYSGVTMDGAGNLYGTTYGGGASHLGTVYELKVHGSGYLHNQLHALTGGNDGEQPWGGVVFGPQGGLIGTTIAGGFENAGTVFSLMPPFRICRSVVCPWTETLPGDFGYLVQPSYGEVAFDHSGNIYGTTAFGGEFGYGGVYELSRSGSGWTETVLHSFQDNPDDGKFPAHNVILDSAGNLYGTTDEGGSYSEGTVFQLVPSGSGWTINILANLGQPGSGIGGFPLAGLIMDRAGNFYGATAGDTVTASVFELSPSGSGWQLTVLHTFSTPGNNTGPFGNLVLDSSGNLYGTTETLGAFGLGNIFKLTPSGGSWTYTDLYDFTNNGDGQYPTGDLIIDSEGNLYGTNIGDSTGHGVVWKLTP
jgi:uncharacterized repeat protein (TIGR03803 family)